MAYPNLQVPSYAYSSQKIDNDKPMAEGLTHYWLGHPAALIDIINKTTATVINTPTFEASVMGYGVYTEADGEGMDLGDLGVVDSSDGWTMACGFYPRAYAGWCGIMENTSSGAHDDVGLLMDGSNNFVSMQDNNGYFDGGLALSTDLPTLALAAHYDDPDDGSKLRATRMLVQGSTVDYEDLEIGVGASPADSQTLDNLKLGRDYFASNRTMHANWTWAALWRSKAHIDQKLLEQFASAPYDIIWRPKSIFLFTAAAGEVVAVAEALTCSDTFLASVNAQASFSDGFAVSEVQTAIAAAAVSLSESVAGSDSKGGQSAALAVLSESATSSDVVHALASAAASLVDGAALGEVWATNSAEAVALVESFTASDTWAAVSTALGGLSEAVLVSDAVSAIVSAKASVSDGVVISDTITAVDQGAETGTVIDSVLISDTYLAAVISVASLSGGADLSDASVAIMHVLNGLSESVTVNDMYLLTKTFPVAVNESTALGDVVSIVANLVTALSEGALLGDVLAAGVSATAAITEGLGISDAWATSGIPGFITASISLVAAIAGSVSAGPAVATNIIVN